MSSADERSVAEPRSDARPRLAGLALSWSDGAALLAVLLWGLNFPVTKSLMSVADPSAVTFLRAACSTLVFLVVLGIKGQWELPARRDVGPFLLVGLAVSGMAPLAQSSAGDLFPKRAGAAVSVVITFGSGGGLLATPLVGGLAELAGLRAALGLVVAAGLAVFALSLRERDGRSG